MFAFLTGRSGRDPVAGLHARIVAASRDPALYGEGGLPDTIEGRFEALSLWALVVMRRLRQLPPPADEVSQELVDALFAHLEVALREIGVGDFGVPKRMKKLGQAFYDRAAKYDPVLDRKDLAELAREMAGRIGGGPPVAAARAILRAEAAVSGADLERLLRDEPRPSREGAERAEVEVA